MGDRRVYRETSVLHTLGAHQLCRLNTCTAPKQCANLARPKAHLPQSISPGSAHLSTCQAPGHCTRHLWLCNCLVGLVSRLVHFTPNRKAMRYSKWFSFVVLRVDYSTFHAYLSNLAHFTLPYWLGVQHLGGLILLSTGRLCLPCRVVYVADTAKIRSFREGIL